MPQNLVPGGARRGRFVTRLNRVVEIHTPVMADCPLEPGQTVPTKKQLWKGTLFMQDGRTPDSEKLWEESGAFAEMNGVSSPLDLDSVIRLAPEPEAAEPPKGELEAPEPEAAEPPKAEAPKPEAAEPSKKAEKKSDKAA